VFNHDARPKMVDAPLTLISIIGQSACRFLFGLQRRPILSVCIKTSKSLIHYLTYKTINRWCSVDAQFQNWAGSVSLSLLPIKAAYTSVMNVSDQTPCRVTMMQSQTLLTHCWHSFSQWGRQCVTVSFAYKCSLYLIYEGLHPIATQITQDARPKIIDSPLTLIVRMWQGVCLTCFWLYRQPIHQKRTTIYLCQQFVISNRIFECDHK